jgi:metallo-beta-lactamase family protein
MEDLDFLISESTYGGRVHVAYPNDLDTLFGILQKAITRKGKIIIPAFSVGRTQEILYMLDKLYLAHKIDRLPVFVDSPLSTNTTQIYRNHPECFDEEILNHIKNDPNPFGFNTLTFTHSVDESKALNNAEGPMIIISASGMAEAGRVVHHLFNSVSDPNNTVILVGYCAEGSLGARLRERPEFVTIFGEEKALNADIEMMDSFSGHGDQNEMLQYLQSVKTKRLKQTFLVHGEHNNMQAMQQVMQQSGYGIVHMPKLGEVVPLQI